MNGEEFLTHSSCSLQELEMILKRKLQLFPIPFINNTCISLIEEILREIEMYVVATGKRECAARRVFFHFSLFYQNKIIIQLFNKK